MAYAPAVLSVSVPYKITLLSNGVAIASVTDLVSVPYKITLLSNGHYDTPHIDEFQYLIKLHYSQTQVYY